MSAKRYFDIFFSLTAIIFFLPIAFIIAIALKLFSEGPIFYTARRVGKGGHLIHCLKFRTMKLGAEEALPAVLAQNPSFKSEWERYHKLRNDPRVTPLGKILRKASLDELPQFWNVLKGDLSVVGPRPATPDEVEKYFGSKAPKILSVRPGLTGIWQTSGRNLLSFEERLLLEERYIDSRSLKLDLWIICKTIPVFLSSKGAF